MSSLDDFGRRLEKNLRHLRKWRARHGVTCFRVYDRDLPEYPLCLDVYEKWLHVQEFESTAADETLRFHVRLSTDLGHCPTNGRRLNQAFR